MSTRSQIGFYNAKPDSENLDKWEALIYRHYDGYPSGVLPDIIPFLKWWKDNRGIIDTEYLSARLLQWLCNEYDKDSLAFSNKIYGDTKTYKFTGELGHGICKEFHRDIEYYYAIYPSGVMVFDVPFDSKPNEWKEIIFIDLSNDESIAEGLHKKGYTLTEFLICIGALMLLGLGVAWMYRLWCLAGAAIHYLSK